MKTAKGEAREAGNEVPLSSATPEEGDLDAATEEEWRGLRGFCSRGVAREGGTKGGRRRCRVVGG